MSVDNPVAREDAPPAEAAAELKSGLGFGGGDRGARRALHRRIREEWGFADEDGPTLAGLFRQLPRVPGSSPG